MKKSKNVAGGAKYDDNKLRWDLYPTEAMEEVIKVFTMGATKYDDRNWEKGIVFNRLLAASRRHEIAFLKGEMDNQEVINDKPYRANHLAHSIVNKLMLLQFILENRPELDNLNNKDKRWKK